MSEGRELIVVGEQGVVPAEQEVSLVEGAPEVVEGEWREAPEEKIEIVQEPRYAVSNKETAAYKAGVAAGRAGRAAGGLLAGIGAKLESTAPPAEDDLSDLFEGPDMSKDNDVYIDDLVAIDEEDVFGDGGSDMSDLLEVSDEDLEVGEDVLSLGEGCPGKQPTQRKQRVVVVRKAPTGGLSGVQY